MPEFFTSVYVPSDLSAEAKTLIEKHVGSPHNRFARFEDLAKDLVNFISRPDLIYEVFRQIIYNPEYKSYQYPTAAKFAETLTDSQILKLTETRPGNFLLNKLFNIFKSSSANKNPTIANAAVKLIMRIESVRFQIIANDKRPLIADMVENNEGLYQPRDEKTLDDLWLMERNAFHFGIGHDGEHILGNRNGSRVKAIAGLTGIILTYHKMLPANNYAVYILLNDNRNVIVLKDLINLSPTILKAPSSTKIEDKVPIFIDKKGKPISTVKIGVGETIGFTAKWNGNINSSATGLHFTIVKYQFVQQFRKFLVDIGIVFAKDAREHTNKGDELIKNNYKNWLIVPCSSESPVRCK